MARSRCMLARSKLKEFIEFCESQGWVLAETKDFYEVVRMRKYGEKDPLIVHSKLGNLDPNDVRSMLDHHYTTWGNSQKLCSAYLKSKKVTK